MVDLIYCSGGNKRFAEIAINAGFLYGAQLPRTTYFPIFFADQDWKNPNKDAYLSAVASHSPTLATVLDLEQQDQLPTVLAWAEEIAPFCQTTIIIPKVFGIIPSIPHTIAGNPIRLGFSVPTSFGGTSLPLWEFADRPVHLLGGSPQQQMNLFRYLNVQSVDGNQPQLMAVRTCSVWHPGTARHAKNRYWPTLRELDIDTTLDAPYVAFELSCQNIMQAWQSLR